ncbi:hypothetical protein [Halopseudomonas sabulinigri]|uniref:Uncharacterized protein n=1 Tax=Halopseudomonas sabulinigri TaxID=472181 RepID=A0ABP9ZS73_9GAMM
MRAYLDTEFTQLNQYEYKLISLALVVPDGPELYVELTDAWQISDCSDFVLEIVLPQLDLEVHGRTTEQARGELLDFLEKLGRVEIMSDAPAWDWPLLVWLAGSSGLPGGVSAGQISDDIDISYDPVEPPHHALIDARLLAEMVEGKRNA